MNELKIIDQNITGGINITALVYQCDVTRSSWTLSHHFIRNSLYFSHFGAKSKAYKARKKCLFKGKSIGRSQPTSVSQVKPDLMISLGSLGP